MANFQELNKWYKELFQKDFPRATLTRWVQEEKIVATKENGRYNYDLESFKKIVQSNEYQKKLKGQKEKPENYIGKIQGNLLITGIVPNEHKKEQYKGTLMYCKCLLCGTENIQVRFSYLTNNSNYQQSSCGCNRKMRAFLASCRKDITEEFLSQFKDFEKFLFVHKLLKSSTDKYYTDCSIEEYENAIKYLIEDSQFNLIYNFWKNNEKKYTTFYDWAKPSLDHIIPKSKGGTHEISNLQVLTVFENLAKRDLTQEEWTQFKKQTNTQSNYFIESILQQGGQEYD